MGRPPPQICWGDRPPSPPRSPPLLLPMFISNFLLMFHLSFSYLSLLSSHISSSNLFSLQLSIAICFPIFRILPCLILGLDVSIASYLHLSYRMTINQCLVNYNWYLNCTL